MNPSIIPNFVKIARLRLGSERYCRVCNSKIGGFLDRHGRNDVLCPICGSKERHRVLWHYLTHKTSLFEDQHRLLYVAPIPAWERQFRKCESLTAVTTDLQKEGVDVKGDVTELPFNDGEFDAVLCSHVLEHVPDDIGAMKEFYRVLSSEGWALVHVPMKFNKENTFEDPTVEDPERRSELFGQHNHVRWYGLDFEKRLQSVGFKVCVNDYLQSLDEQVIQQEGMTKQLIHHCRKV